MVKGLKRRLRALGIALASLFYDVRITRKGEVFFKLRQKRPRISKKHHA